MSSKKDLSRILSELKKKNAALHKSHMQTVDKTEPKNRVKLLHTMQVDNAKGLKLKKEELSSEKLQESIEKEIIKSIVFDLKRSDKMIQEYSKFIGEWDELCKQFVIHAELNFLAVPVPAGLSIRKDVLKSFSDAFGSLFDFKKIPLIEAVEIAKLRRSEAVSNINKCLAGLDEFDAYRNGIQCLSTKSEPITHNDSAYSVGSCSISEGKGEQWFDRRGFTGIKLHAVKTNLVQSELYREARFPALVEKEKKAQASI